VVVSLTVAALLLFEVGALSFEDIDTCILSLAIFPQIARAAVT